MTARMGLRLACFAFIAAASTARAAGVLLHGEIKICRRPGFDAATVNRRVTIPVSDPASYTNTYTRTCDHLGENCRNIEVAVTKSGVVGPGWKSCAVLPAILFESDGHPLKAGQHLLTQWSVDGFEPLVTVTMTFH